MESKDRQTANRKRNLTLRYLKQNNLKLADALNKRKMDKKEKTEQKKTLLQKLIKSLRTCANLSLYGETSESIRFLTSITCEHKLCAICNWNRQKKIRRKYFKWFGSNQYLVEIGKDGKSKVTTQSQKKDYIVKGWEVLNEKIPYDLMHLTLTVPHSKEYGYKGNPVYFDALIRDFNFLRKSEYWQKHVFGGEYGIETTKGDNGYHIHIHALLLVKKEQKNRNQLHRQLLLSWNRLTVDERASRKAFTEKELQKIRNGNSLLSDKDMSQLNPKGTTLIGLECIYTKNQGVKTRATEWGSDAMIVAVMETISYHFKPKIFNSENGFYDIDTIVDLLPHVYRRTLYRKTDCLHGEKSLNVKDNSLTEDYEETAEEYNEETGEVYESIYFITNPLYTYPKGDEYEIGLMKKHLDRVEILRTHSAREAVKELNNRGYHKNN
jgi:plasmid rolling circle replication initiator protein Rep